MTTREAFEQLIRERAWYKKAGLSETTGTNLKVNFKNGKITIDKMEEVLLKSGFIVKQEKLWQK